jgi:hypothetical protein
MSFTLGAFVRACSHRTVDESVFTVIDFNAQTTSARTQSRGNNCLNKIARVSLKAFSDVSMLVAGFCLYSFSLSAMPVAALALGVLGIRTLISYYPNKSYFSTDLEIDIKSDPVERTIFGETYDISQTFVSDTDVQAGNGARSKILSLKVNGKEIDIDHKTSHTDLIIESIVPPLERVNLTAEEKHELMFFFSSILNQNMTASVGYQVYSNAVEKPELKKKCTDRFQTGEVRLGAAYVDSMKAEITIKNGKIQAKILCEDFCFMNCEDVVEIPMKGRSDAGHGKPRKVMRFPTEVTFDLLNKKAHYSVTTV